MDTNFHIVRQRGFSLVELMLCITVMGLLTVMMGSKINWSPWKISGISGQLIGDFSSIEAGFRNYWDEKGVYPANLSDATFVPGYLFVPIAPSVFDTAYGVSGYLLGQQTGQPSPNNGYYICAKVVVANAEDPRYRALEKVAEQMSMNKFFYGAACPAVANVAVPAGATTIYPTYWITRN